MLRNLRDGGFTGTLYAVSTETDDGSIAGVPAYDSIRDINGQVDLAVVAVPAEAVADVMLDRGAKGCSMTGGRVRWVGFAEIGEEGRRRQRHLVGLARSYGRIQPSGVAVSASPRSALPRSVALSRHKTSPGPARKDNSAGPGWLRSPPTW